MFTENNQILRLKDYFTGKTKPQCNGYTTEE